MVLLKPVFTVVMLLLSVGASSSSYQGKVKSVFAYSGKVFITVGAGSFDNSNTCTGQTAGLTLWLDPASEYDKVMLSLALTAKVTDKLVWVAGGSCSSGPFGQAEKIGRAHV